MTNLMSDSSRSDRIDFECLKTGIRAVFRDDPERMAMELSIVDLLIAIEDMKHAK